MPDPFVHLHVASGFSLQHGASHPHELVARAVEHGMTSLALTDRDGVYGAVRFVAACRAAGLRPVLGVDLAVAGDLPDLPGSGARPGRSQPVRGGSYRDRAPDPGVGVTAGARPDEGLAPARALALPRVTLLARDARGWAALCRLVSATHLAGERGTPVTDLRLLAEHAGPTALAGGLVALLGPGSGVGRALAARRPDLARRHLDRWREVLGVDAVVLEVVSHREQGASARAARAVGFAREHGARAVLTNAVRHADRADAPVADLLDAARRLVVLDARHLDRRTGEAYLKSGKEMAEVAAEVAAAAGCTDGGRGLLAATRHEADRCALDPVRDLGIGDVSSGEVPARLPELLGPTGVPVAGPTSPRALMRVLRQRALAGVTRRGLPSDPTVLDRLDAELEVVAALRYPSYFLTVADVVDLVRSMGVRVAARGSGAGSLLTYLLGISDVDPLRHGLLMERFLSTRRRELPDIDLDLESARRTEVYTAVLERYGGERCCCVSMRETYRARHALRDVGTALGLPRDEVDGLAKAFPHVRASQITAAARDLPEVRRHPLLRGWRPGDQVDRVLRLAERLDGLPRHVALHPCGVVLSDRSLLDRTPVESSWLGFPMTQFDKDDVEALGLLKLDLLGIRMQSAMQHAVAEVARVDGVQVDLDAVPHDDPATFALVRSTRTLGCFQIESPGQRELVGKFGPRTFEDLVVDISLFRPGPVKSDMIRPFLEARQGWAPPRYAHPDLVPVLAETEGVVVFHEQVLRILALFTGCSLAEADEVRRALGRPEGQEDTRVWFFPAALGRGYPLAVVEEVWEVLKAFGSFGFCKAHAAAFALTTYHSAWLKAHHPAAFLAGVLTHDPGMYPKRLVLDDARQMGVAVLPLDVNRSGESYLVERVGRYDEPPPAILDQVPGDPLRAPRPAPTEEGVPDGRGYGIRVGLADVRGITAAEIARLLAGRPFSTLADLWHRAEPSRPVLERLVLAGGLDSLYGLDATIPVRRRGQLTRRDLLLQVAQMDRLARLDRRAAARGRAPRPGAGPGSGRPVALDDVRARREAQSQQAAPVRPVTAQLTLDLAGAGDTTPSGLPELTQAERTRAELDVLGLDVSAHVLAGYEELFADLGVTRARDLLRCRSGRRVLVAGVKVATQTPPVRSGRRVVFLTLDDATGPVDATFFEEAQQGASQVLFHSWLLVVRGEVRRTGPRGVSLLADGGWELVALHDLWRQGGAAAVHALLEQPLVMPDADASDADPSGADPSGAGTVHRYATGRTVSAYTDVRPAGGDRPAGRRLWHASPGSAG